MSETAVAYAANGTALADHGEALPGLLREDGYVLPPGLPFERWRGIMETLQAMQRSVNWWAGDALRYGEDNYGEAAYQAVQDMTGKGDEALRQAVWVASKFPTPDTRVTALSWSHHRAVAELEPEDRQAMLREAVEEGLSTRELIARVKDRQASIDLAPASSASEPVCAADRAWVPSKDDLLPEHRAALERAALDADLDDPTGFAAGALWMARYTSSEALFRPDRWRED